MIIKILGTGCPKCQLFTQTIKDSIAELGLEAEIIKVQEMSDIMAYDIMSLPGLVINEKLILAGKAPNKEMMKIILMANK